jgi:hypothetical protein
MIPLSFILICTLLKLLSADCSLERFPSELHFSDQLDSPIPIDDYVISEYPSYTSDFTPPINLEREYSIINHSKPFAHSVPYPYFITPFFEQDHVWFGIYNIETELMINRTIEFAVSQP